VSEETERSFGGEESGAEEAVREERGGVSIPEGGSHDEDTPPISGEDQEPGQTQVDAPEDDVGGEEG
jgi:hypothetical protein